MSNEIIDVPLSQIDGEDPFFQRNLQDENLDQLMTSIERDGQIEAILLAQVKDCYRIVEGNRRFRACRRLGRNTILARVLSAEEANLKTAVVANVHREGLDPLSKFRAVEQYLNEHPDAEGKEVGQLILEKASTANKYMRVARAADPIKDALKLSGKSNRKEKGDYVPEAITFSTAKELAYLKDEKEQKAALKAVIRWQEKNKRDIRRAELQSQILGESGADSEPAIDLSPLEEQMTSAVGAPVRLSLRAIRNGKRQLLLEALSERDMERLLDCLDSCLASFPRGNGAKSLMPESPPERSAASVLAPAEAATAVSVRHSDVDIVEGAKSHG